MNKTREISKPEKITVDISGLVDMLSVGRGTANAIGEKAGAVVRVGGRKLYNVRKVQDYVDSISTGNADK